jgi:hypothetical protein
MVKGGGVELPPRVISSYMLDRNEIPTATPLFSGINFSMVPNSTSPDASLYLEMEN